MSYTLKYFGLQIYPNVQLICKHLNFAELLELLEKGQGGCHSPAHSTTSSISAPSTPTSNNNNNITKIISRAVPQHSSAVTAAVNNLSSITSINANINLIEIKAATNTNMVEHKVADDIIYNNLTNDDLSVLDHSLTLDPALNDLALQVGSST